MKARLSRPVRALTLLLPAVVTAALLGAPPVYAAKAQPFRPGPAPAVAKVPVTKGAAGPAARSRVPMTLARPAPVWPSASTVDVGMGQVVPGTPVTVTASTARTAVSGARPSRVHLEIFDRGATARAGVSGLLLRVGRADGQVGAAPVGLSVDFGSFATAYGGDWTSRLRLAALPDCALTTPGRAGCRGTVLPTRLDQAHHTAAADVTVGPAGSGAQVVALAAAPSGSAGSFGATGLSPSGNWSAGGSSGDFSWTYPMRTPPGLGGPAPVLELSYSSQSVDGRMAAANNQPSVVGEGFELSTGGYIERRYKTCSDDKTNGNNASGSAASAADQCWATDNATMSLDGKGSELIKDATNPNLWHLRDEDGSKVEHRTGADNGAQQGEWWVVTSANGTQYWFGRNKLPGNNGTATNSTWTEPVFGNQSGEPCHQATFAASSCTQAWRWNLDYVVDPHDNTMSYWYAPETERYAAGNGSSVTYTRGGYLDHLVYGSRVDPSVATGTDTVFSGHPAARIDFHYDDRCLANCGTHDATHWPDTPWDLDCPSGTCAQTAPVFWTTRRLSTITTSVYDAGLGHNRDVERWTLFQTFPDAGEGTHHTGLWLDHISHSGLVGTATTMPDVTFVGTPLPNRVDGVDNAPPMDWLRLSDINSETGGIVHIDYAAPDCVAGTRVPDKSHLENNTLRCYPVKWTPPGFAQETDFFQKYVVANVTETDRTGGATRILHHYDYYGDPAWHYTDDDGLIKAEEKTWSQWRGYQKVGITTGDPGAQTYSESLFFRGMNGDHLPTGTRSATITDSLGGTIVDGESFAGMTRETRTLNGPGGAEVSGEINDPWQSAPTATRTLNGTTVNARFVNTEGTHSRVALDHAPWVRITYSKSTFDAYGMVVKEDDYGDETVTGDEQCTTTTYEPRNSTVWLMSLPQRATSYALSCDQVASGPVTDADVIGDSRTSYDGHDFGVAPTQGDVTRTEGLAAWNSGSPTYVQLTRTAYDIIGRAVDSWDALNRHSGTAYTPATTGPVTQTVDTNPKGWTTTTTVEPAWGLATSTVDANELRTDLAYDGLGRLTGVWSPGRTKGTETPDISYEYLIRTGAVNAVVTHHLNPKGNTTTSYALYDGLLRPRQTQNASPAGGRIVTDTFYDAAGRAVLDYGAYYAAGAPGTDLVTAPNALDVPNQTRTLYDGAGRVAATVFQPHGVERWRTTTTYGGDHTDVSPPAGATASSTVTDARDRTVELRQYPTRTPGGTDYDRTQYSYNRKGLLEKATAPDGSVYTYAYDSRGRRTSSTDPDTGTTTTAYDDGSRVTKTTDSRNVTLLYTYDDLDRKTNLYQGSISSSNQLAEWDYDDATFADNVTPVLGQGSRSIRFDNGHRYTVSVNHYDNRYRALSSTVDIPVAETGLGGSYTFATGYNPDGSIAGSSYPRTGDLQPESVLYDYTDFDQPLDLVNLYGTNPESSTVSDSHYDALGHATQYTLSTGLTTNTGTHTYLGMRTDPDTGRLSEIITSRDTVAPNTISDIHYTYNDVGNVTKIADTPTGGDYSDTQCFTYDRYQRVTDAWTPQSGDCSAAPSALGGPAPYWQTYSYSSSGLRTRLVDHQTATGDVTTNYAYPTIPADPSTGQPHTLTGTTTTDNTGTHTAAYTFDKSGNTLTRPGANGTQTLKWTTDGQLQSVTDTSGSVSYVYDADGNRLIRRDTTGKTLYLPGEELRYTSSTASLSCTRYYSFAGGTVAQRTASGITWLASDHQGTQDISVNEQTQAYTVRRQTPFGTARGPATLWPNEKGFVGGTDDPTGLIHLGAREYDPTIGRFVSSDPILDTSDPQQLQGYAYAENSPIARSDPSGQRTEEQYYGPAGAAEMDNKQDLSQEDKDKLKQQNDDSHKKKKCGWGCKFKHAASAAGNWVDKHKAEIAGTVAGIVVGAGCGALIGWTGVGAVACGALSGAVGNMVTYAIQTKVEHKGNFSLGGMLKTAAVGAIVGGVMGGLGSIAGSAIKAGVGSLISGAGAKAAAGAAGAAVRKEAGNIANGLTRGAFTKGAAEAAEGAAPKGCPGSFTARTAVLMANGSRKAIQDVRAGDKVVATDPITGKRTLRTVTQVRVDRDKALTKLTVRVNGHDAVLSTTQHHPFWDENRQMWAGAGDLAIGEHVATDGGTGTVTAVANSRGTQDMFNLTVDVTHTYYVIAGDTPVLVHNCPLGAARSAADNAPSDATMAAGARFRGTDMTETGYSGASSRPAYLEPEVGDALGAGGQTFEGDAANCAEIRACNNLIATHGGAFEDRFGRPPSLADIEFITVRVATKAVESACLSCVSVLVMNGATDLARGMP